MSSRRRAFIGVDAGTSGCKTVLLGGDNVILAQARQTYSTRRLVSGETTQDAGDWLAAVADTVRSCVEQAGGVDVEGLSVTAPAHNAVLVGEDGEPLDRVVLWSDTRPSDTATMLKRDYGDELFEKSFVELGPAWTFPQLVWLREQLPHETWSRVRHVLTGKDYIRYRMTGVAATDPSDAAGTAMYDQREGAWLEALCRECGLSPEHFPSVCPALETGGRLNEEWARRTGLPAGTPVSVGATDTAAELVSVGATETGSALVKIASTGTAVAVSAEPKPDRRALTYPHAVSGHWYTLAATNASATARQWLEEVLFDPDSAGQPQEAQERVAALAERIPAGAEGVLFLPFLEGERSPYWDPNLRAGFLGVSSSHDRSHLCRAVLEGVALSIRTCRDLLGELGLPVESPYLTGGGNASKLWRTILVSALGETGYLSEPQGPAVGAALIARATAQADPQVLAGSEAPSQAVRPCDEWLGTYDRLYDVYHQAASGLAEISHRLVELSTTEEHVE